MTQKEKEVKGKNLSPPPPSDQFPVPNMPAEESRDVEIVAYSKKVRSQGTLAHFDKENASSEESLLCDSFPTPPPFFFFRISENFPTVGVPKLIQFVCIYTLA